MPGVGKQTGPGHRCGAKSRQSGQPCRAWAMKNGRCRIHGGKSVPPGLAHHSTTAGGRYSKYLPARLAAKYQDALNSKELLSLRDDVAICETRIGELLERVESGESGTVWQRLQELNTAFQDAQRAHDVAGMQKCLIKLQETLTLGSDDYAAWAELHKMWETRRRLTDTELKALVAHQQILTTEQMLIAIGLIEQIMYRRVTEHAEPELARTILVSISNDLKKEAFLGLVN